MAFDPSTAQPESGGQFDPSTARLEDKKKSDTSFSPLFNLQQAIGEPILAMGTGAIAKPLSDIAGLGAIPLHAAGLISTDPEAVKNAVQQGMTYAPRTEAGKFATEYNPLALVAKGVDWVGNKAQQGIGVDSPLQAGLGQGIHEAINQAPAFLGIKGGTAADALAAATKDSARNWMQSALKPPLASLKSGKAASAIDTMLNEGINVSPGGLEKLQTGIEGLNNQIKSQIAGSSATVGVPPVLAAIQQVKDRALRQVAPQSDLAAIQSVYDNFQNHPMLQRGGAPGYSVTAADIPVQLAQDLKQGTYRALSDRAYGQEAGAAIEAQKAAARALKEGVANAVPDVRPLNAQESQLLTALPLVERRVLMEANKNPAGLAWLTTSPTKFAAFMADRSGLFKSLVARMLNTQAESTIPAIGGLLPPTGIAVSQGAGLLGNPRRPNDPTFGLLSPP